MNRLFPFFVVTLLALAGPTLRAADLPALWAERLKFVVMN